MSEFKTVKYSSLYYDEWNNFVSNAKNATFLFHRDFMDYHRDRFEDYSLLVFKNGKILAVFPANQIGDSIFSHKGLTYGGLAVEKLLKFQDVVNCFKVLLIHLKTNGFKLLNLKIIPAIYNDFPSDEINYLMFVLKAELIRRDILSVIDLRKKNTFSKNRIEGCKRANKYSLKIKEDSVFDDFWNNILIPKLKSKHDVSPVHSLDEIKILKQRFPNNIRQFNVYLNQDIVAGTTIFETKNVAHVQYISANKDKNILGSLDFLFSYLIENVFQDKKYFDFGISNENEGKNINQGLLFWKEGFGARSITQDFYRIDIKNDNNLNRIML